MILLVLMILFSQMLAIQCELIKDSTLKAMEPFSASGDAGTFKKEIQDDASTNRDKLVDIWFHRTYNQRKQIANFYNANFCSNWDHCPLDCDFEEISTDSMRKLYSLSFWSPEAILGSVVYESIIDKWKEMGAIEKILCANDCEFKRSIAEYYQLAYKDTVENHLGTFRKDDTEYQHVMQQYCWKGLCQDKKLKPEDAEKEAKALRAIDPEKDKEGFKKKLIELLDKNCEPDMKLIFEKYRQGKNGIENAVEKAVGTSERTERAYNRLVRYIENTCQFYADELQQAVDGVGTDIDKINRIILTRCERDLKCILNKYKEIHEKTFTNRLKWDTDEDRYLKSIRFLCGKT